MFYSCKGAPPREPHAYHRGSSKQSVVLRGPKYQECKFAINWQHQHVKDDINSKLSTESWGCDCPIATESRVVCNFNLCRVCSRSFCGSSFRSPNCARSTSSVLLYIHHMYNMKERDSMLGKSSDYLSMSIAGSITDCYGIS